MLPECVGCRSVDNTQLTAEYRMPEETDRCIVGKSRRMRFKVVIRPEG